ncbi:hypothetical protein MKQ68_06790 [Chitinophaga horti]|uniref:Uncharacterized protein n=1 Tax=Chitinophaga horti TaxID=2920382 RepID=A0ABY6J598_9BACT|nr:hypothetical protein [Chitinophaga horti]UYQ94797.1 hypothetical protein MKQ68_06790 [Chitinophaga horti]
MKKLTSMWLPNRNRHLLTAIIALFVLLLNTGCKKDKDDNSGGTYSFSNTEYTGTARVGNHYYPRPLSLRFGADETVSAFSYLTLSQWQRNFEGKITKVQENAQGQTEVTVLFDLPGNEQFNSPQTFTISADKKTITGGTPPIVSMVDMKLYPKTSHSIVGNWSQPANIGWFPDVNAISFDKNGQTTYTQGGKPIMATADPTDPSRFKLNYKQDGSRITFSGINITAWPEVFIIPYYGVISADGKTLYLDSYDFSAASLTSSFSTFEWNGPKGVTPWLLREK